MTKIGISYAYWADSWDADVFPLIPRAAAIGFDIIEIGSGVVVAMNDDQRKQFRDLLDENNIEAALCIGLPAEMDIASPDAAIRQAGIDELKQTAEVMEATGVKTLGGVIFGQWLGSLPEDADSREPFVDRSVESLTKVMEFVGQCDVTFCVEPVNRFESYVINTAAEAVEYVKQIGAPNLKILLDTFHMNIEEDSIRESILTCGDLLHHLHLGEPNRRAPGRGRFPWDEFCGALKEIDYKGTMSMEPFLQTAGQVGRMIGVFRDLTDGMDLDEEAGRALAFMREKTK